MNINEAKNEIKRTVEIYLQKDADGNYEIPYNKQRPVYLVGAPGVGKTAIMEQVANELDIALVSYSMSHHTRQSALGLPYITDKEYNGQTMKVSDYTLSEIIGTIYDVMERSGKKEGILFLDEINCVSETLAPSMLQFLQYKVFGNKQVPQGWVVVTAGNPPQYNKSVKKFDIATQDRLRIMKIQEDIEAWLPYAHANNVHGSIIAFLEANRDYFFRFRTTVDSVVFATARGWEDLSMAIRLYEKKGFTVDTVLISQYIPDNEIAEKFSIFYDLYIKYHKSYDIESILKGDVAPGVIAKARNANFDERISVIELILDRMNQDFLHDTREEDILQKTVHELRLVKKSGNMEDGLSNSIKTVEDSLAARKAANNMTAEQEKVYNATIRQLTEYRSALDYEKDFKGQFEATKKVFKTRTNRHAKSIENTGKALDACFKFIEDAWGDAQEMVLFVTSLTGNALSSTFINNWGCDAYFRHNSDILTFDAKERIMQEIESLEIA